MMGVMRRIRSMIKRALNAPKSIRRPPRVVAPVSPFTADMTIEKAWTHHPQAPEVFQRFHLPACSGCAVRFEETVEEAMTAYGIDLDSFLNALNDLRS